jgi:PAS domain S-box-containing protein
MATPSQYLFETIRDGPEFMLYSARQRGNDMPLLVVAPTAERPLPQSLRRLEHEYSLAAELEPGWAAKPIALTRHEGRTILVLADPGAEPLDRILERASAQPLDLARILNFSINLATALSHAHERGLIHKDIKPENVLVALEPGDDVGHVWLTGFGIASRLPRERQPPAPPETVAGTLAYMSPEQTGRMNRSMDTRSDLYSLGVTLYEMLTGVLPFAAADPLEWVHCHIARYPVAPVLAVTHTDRRAVPEPLSAIVMRLLAKNAEDRYQTASGLVADLRRCLVEWQTHGRIDSFPLGADDTSDRLLIPEKLYGREREVDTLLAAFDRVVAGGRPELVLVSGYSGVGKSAVVNELHKSLVPPRGLFASGKFDQYKRDIPYATVAQAFQSLIRPLLSRPESELSQFRDELGQALGPNGSLLVDLVPELKLIIGEQPAIAALPPQEAKIRSHLTFRRFLGVFARPEHPLALFLDDLQWLDAATLDFLEGLLVQEDLAHLLVVGAYRDNEVDRAHPLIRRLAAIREAGAAMQEIRLTPLGSGDLTKLIADALHCDPQRATPLAQLIHGKTAGNPFFAIQFIYALAEEALITFEHAGARWRWDPDAIRAKGYSDNVVDLMVDKLNRLPATTQKALLQFACIGNSADAATLSAVLEMSESETEAELWEALHQELIVRSEDSYRFVHDRIQEAAYSLIAEGARAEAHLRIGRLLHAHTPPEKREEAIFEIVNQLNRGAEFISSEDERFRVAELNVIAGKRAKASTAYASALKYFIAGEVLLTDAPWERCHDLIFQLELYRAECEFLTGEPVIAAERVEILRSRSLNTVDLAAATCLGIDVYMTLGQVDRVVATGLDYLRHVNIECPLQPTEEQVRSEYERIWSQLGARKIEEAISFPLMTDPTSIATLDVLTKLLPPAMFTDTNLYSVVVCRAVGLSIEHGNGDASCSSYAWLGRMAGHRFGDYRNAFRFGQLGYDLIEKRGLKRFQAATSAVFASGIMPWMKPLLACCNVMRQAFEIANKIGDLTYAAYISANIDTLLIAMGGSLVEVQGEAENGLRFAKKAKFGFAADLTNAQIGLIRTLRGLTTEFGSFEHAEFDETRFEGCQNSCPPTVLCRYWIRKLQARFFAGDFASAIEASLKARPLLLYSPSFELAEYEFYSALARAALWSSATGGQSREHFDALAAHYKQLQIWAENCPENFENRVVLVGAEIARIEGRALDAIQLYEQAIRSARANGFVHNEAVAYEVAAQFYSARGFETFADAYLRNARNCYARWGADGKVKQLDELHPRLREEQTSASSATIEPPVRQLDVETVVKASQAVSSEMDLPALIEKLVRIAVESAGAERGLLILLYGGEPRIEAEATTGRAGIEVVVRQAAVAPSDLPQSALHYVIRTQEGVLLDDASADSVYSKDEYVRQKRSKSILCLPVVKQAKLVGALYLENNLTVGAFTPDRVTVLQLLASQAAISLENAGLYSDLQLQAELLQRLPVSAWTLKPDGTPDFVNEVWLEYSGQNLDFIRSRPEAWMTAVHPEDREAATRAFSGGIRSGQGFAVETRSLRAQDGTYRWHLNQAVVLRNAEGKALKFVGTTTDIDDQKRAEEKLRESANEAHLIVDSIPGLVALVSPTGNLEMVSRQALEFFGRTIEELRGWGTNDTIHPQDLPGAIDAFTRAIATGRPYEFSARFRRRDGVYRWFLDRGFPLRDKNGDVARWYLLITDIDDQKRAEEALRESEHESRLIVDSIPGLIAVLNVNGEIEGVSQPILDYFGRSLEELRQWAVDDTIHPDDRPAYLQAFERCFTVGDPFEFEVRTRRFDGIYRWFNMRGLPLRDRQGHIVRWYFLLTEIDDRKRAEDKIRQSEKEARQLLDLSPLHITELGSDGARLYTNRASLDYYGITLEEWQAADLQQMLYSQDARLVTNDLPGKLQSGSPFEYEARLKRKDGQYRWFHYRLNPMSDEQGRITRWYAAGTDIDDRKIAEQRLQQENVALREEIDKASMFDEIVGGSAPLRRVLSRISKVAPTDSSVLITGETGTGKELVARAIHWRSRRSSYPFVSVNCAVIPRDLIASELFGHEKGAFTGATQRRLGRFELAEKGTIFLDEVGELPAETQIALLRVLQEREFERIGGSGSMKTDVRVVAATNRDLDAAIAAGAFRSDLYYRLNVFPIEMPTLRERKEDIPLLVTYFLNHYARKAARHFTAVDKKSLDMLQSYAWPGNIRELQNVIERSVIVSETQTFSVDESWLSRRPSPHDPSIQPSLFNRLPAQEKAAIEAALRECGGRVYGPSGAATKLGIPRSTLETKIRALKINKHRFKATDLSTES